MIIYHGHASRPSLKKCREAAPSYTHGVELSDNKTRRRYEGPYIIDNGAYAAYKNGVEWCKEDFIEILRWVEETQPNDPDFVVVPDVVGNAEETYKKAKKWRNRIGFATYQPVQDGMEFGRALDMVEETGSEGIFIGGTKEWKRRKAREWVSRSHDRGMKAHIARPGNLMWADRIGADSVDTTTIVQSQAWEKLRYLENQRTFEDWER